MRSADHEAIFDAATSELRSLIEEVSATRKAMFRERCKLINIVAESGDLVTLERIAALLEASLDCSSERRGFT
jgi:hypothetical protein